MKAPQKRFGWAISVSVSVSISKKCQNLYRILNYKPEAGEVECKHGMGNKGETVPADKKNLLMVASGATSSEIRKGSGWIWRGWLILN